MSKRILVVEDDRDTAEFIAAYLRLKEFDVTVVRDDCEFVEKFGNEQFDILLLDIMLPDKDGFWIARYVRDQKSRIPILMMTGHKTVTYGIKPPPHCSYITKPFDPEHLLQRLNTMLEKARAPVGATSSRRKRERPA
jgi:DNA-binding response OmpR family regulator